jgi:WD40 repeat protein
MLGEFSSMPVEAHFANGQPRINAVCCHSVDQYYATVGNDHRVRIWDMDE